MSLTVLDIGWRPAQLPGVTGWLTGLLGDHGALLVAPASPDGLRRLEAHLAQIAQQGARGPVAVSLLLPPRSARGLRTSPERSIAGLLARRDLGPHTRRLLDHGAVVGVPYVTSLAVASLSTDALPAPVLTAAHRLLDLLDAARLPLSPQHPAGGAASEPDSHRPARPQESS